MIKKIILAVLMFAVVGLVMPMPAFAADPPQKKSVQEWSPVCSTLTDPDAKKAAGCEENEEIQGKISNIYDVIIGIVGVICVVVIIVGGIFMTTSAGDPSKVTKGKNAVIYGIVGLVVSVLAWAIIRFVLSNF